MAQKCSPDPGRQLETFIEAAIEMGLLTEQEAQRMVIDAVIASLQMSVETVKD